MGLLDQIQQDCVKYDANTILKQCDIYKMLDNKSDKPKNISFYGSHLFHLFLQGFKNVNCIKYDISIHGNTKYVQFSFVEKHGMWKGRLKGNWIYLYYGTNLITCTDDFIVIKKYIDKNNLPTLQQN